MSEQKVEAREEMASPGLKSRPSNMVDPSIIADIPWSPGNPEMLFQLEFILDEGSFGVVWKGNLKAGNNDDVAVKMMPFTTGIIDELTSEINFLKEFDSKFVIHYYGTWFNKKTNEVWIVMELAELGSLEGIMLYCEYRFNEQQLAALFARMLLGLEYVHSKGLVHQDIKAKNILLTIKGEVKLADFGVAASVTNVNQNRGAVSGSPHWMAPEILQGSEITQKCDIWSLGITMIELTEGQPPHADIPPIPVISIIPERAAPTFSVPKKWSRSIRSFLSQMCEKDPSKRKSSQELLSHPFVKKEIVNARNGEHTLLKLLAEECYDTVQEYREEFENVDLQSDEEYAGEVQDFLDDSEESESESSSDDDDGPVLIMRGNRERQVVKDKRKTSFRSVVMDENQLAEDDSEDEREKLMRKMLKKKKRKGSKATRRGRGNTAATSRLVRRPRLQTGRSHSLISHAYRKSVNIPKRNLALGFDDLKAERRKNADVRSKDAGEKEETIRKAEELLNKIKMLANRKQF